MSTSRPFRYFLIFVLALAAHSACDANIALLVEDPVGPVGFFSDGGHSAVWISDACREHDATLRICNTGDGIILSSMPGWRAYGYGAIPASMYLYGATLDRTDAMPYGNTSAELRERFWTQHLAPIYPLVEPHQGALMLAHAYRRRIYLLKLKTSAEEDAAVLAEIHERLANPKFHLWTHNCTDFSRLLLDLYFPGEFRRQWSTISKSPLLRLWVIALSSSGANIRNAISRSSAFN